MDKSSEAKIVEALFDQIVSKADEEGRHILVQLADCEPIRVCLPAPLPFQLVPNP